MQTVFVQSIGEHTVTVVNCIGSTLILPISELSQYDDANQYQINCFNQTLSRYGYEIVDGKVVEKCDEGVFYCNECNKRTPLSQEYHSNKFGLRICKDCYEKSHKTEHVMTATPKTNNNYNCFDCGKSFPIASEYHVNALGCRICHNCYVKPPKQRYVHKEPACSTSNDNKLISLSA